LGRSIKVLKIGEIVKLGTKWEKLCEGAGKTISGIKYYIPVTRSMCSMK
jgi:hypothetical protein